MSFQHPFKRQAARWKVKMGEAPKQTNITTKEQGSDGWLDEGNYFG